MLFDKPKIVIFHSLLFVDLGSAHIRIVRYNRTWRTIAKFSWFGKSFHFSSPLAQGLKRTVQTSSDIFWAEIPFARTSTLKISTIRTSTSTRTLTTWILSLFVNVEIKGAVCKLFSINITGKEAGCQGNQVRSTGSWCLVDDLVVKVFKVKVKVIFAKDLDVKVLVVEVTCQPGSG